MKTNTNKIEQYKEPESRVPPCLGTMQGGEDVWTLFALDLRRSSAGNRWTVAHSLVHSLASTSLNHALMS